MEEKNIQLVYNALIDFCGKHDQITEVELCIGFARFMKLLGNLESVSRLKVVDAGKK